MTANADTRERLFNLQQLIETAKAKQYEAQGALANLKAQLKEQFDVSTEEEVKALLLKLEREIEVLTKQIETRLAKLETMVVRKTE